MSPNDDEGNDSKTFGAKRVGGRRSRVSVRIKPELKEALKRVCRARGVSICHIFEALAVGYLEGIGSRLDLGAKSPTINLTVVRDVKRVRRYVKEVMEEALIEDRGSYSQCAECGDRPVVEAFYWADDVHCSRVYYCKGHWTQHKERGGFSGFRQI